MASGAFTDSGVNTMSMWRLRGRIGWGIFAVLVIVVIVRLMLPGWVADYLNKQLDEMGEYHGAVADVELHLWRGAYSLNDLSIEKRSGEIPAPLLSAPRVDISVAWKALFHGAVVATVAFESPEINFVDVPGKGGGQSGGGVDWRAELESIIPIRLDEVDIRDGRIHFRNFDSNPPVDLQATHVDGVIRNLSNIRDPDARTASFDLTARILGGAPLVSSASFDPLGTLRDFSFALKVTGVELTRANDFLQAYAKVDAEKGKGDFVMELTARNGTLDGYAKPLFHDVQIFSWEHDVEKQRDNPLRAAWEIVVGGIQQLFKNQSQDQFATRVAIHGSIDNKEISAWDAVLGILRNAFIEAYRPTFEKLPEKPD